MSNDKKYSVITKMQMIMPWGVALFGVIAAFFFYSEGRYHRAGLSEKVEWASHMCKTFFNIAMGYGAAVLIAMLVIGFIAFIVMIAHLLSSRRNEEFYVKRPFTIWIRCFGSMIGTFVLMLLTIAATYGQSV